MFRCTHVSKNDFFRDDWIIGQTRGFYPAVSLRRPPASSGQSDKMTTLHENRENSKTRKTITISTIRIVFAILRL